MWTLAVEESERVASKLQDAANRAVLVPFLAAFNVDDMWKQSKREEILSQLSTLQASLDPDLPVDGVAAESAKTIFKNLWERLDRAPEDSNETNTSDDYILSALRAFITFMDTPSQGKHQKTLKFWDAFAAARAAYAKHVSVSGDPTTRTSTEGSLQSLKSLLATNVALIASIESCNALKLPVARADTFTTLLTTAIAEDMPLQIEASVTAIRAYLMAPYDSSCSTSPSVFEICEGVSGSSWCHGLPDDAGYVALRDCWRKAESKGLSLSAIFHCQETLDAMITDLTNLVDSLNTKADEIFIKECRTTLWNLRLTHQSGQVLVNLIEDKPKPRKQAGCKREAAKAKAWNVYDAFHPALSSMAELCQGLFDFGYVKEGKRVRTK